MSKNFTWYLLLLVLGTFLWSSCEDIEESPAALVTEDVIYLSGETVRLLGRVITTSDINASDHGFYISEDAAFGNPIIVSLGERVSPGRFIGEASGLKVDQNYFTKSFFTNSSGIVFGNTLEIRTLSPDAASFSPNNGPIGTEVVLLGRNFTQDTEVFFGDRPAQILRIDFESRIILRVPESGDTPLETVRVVIQDREIVLDEKFQYTTGTYERLDNFPVPIRLNDNIFFQTDDAFYVGLGTNAGNTLNPNIWSYNPLTEQWSDSGYIGESLWLSFSAGQYFGGGSDQISLPPYRPNQAFWKFENGSFIKLADLPFIVFNPLSFELGDAIFVMGGGTGLGNEAYRYDKSDQTWTRIGDTPFAVTNTLMSFSYQGKQYVIRQGTKEIFVFDSQTETWSFYGVYPGEVTSRPGFAVVVGDKAQVGLANRSLQTWELNLNTGEWIQKNDFTGSTAAFNVAHFEKDGLVYVLRLGESGAASTMEFWRYDPDGF